LWRSGLAAAPTKGGLAVAKRMKDQCAGDLREARMTRIYAASAAALVCALMAGTAWVAYTGRSDDPYGDCRSGVVAGGSGSIGGPFTLVDQTGATVTDHQVFAKPSLVYFGFTFCPDVCPIDNARNSEAVDILEEQGFDVSPVFISVDPGRDTPEVLADYAANLHPKMIALTGTELQIKAAVDAYRAYSKVPADRSGDYEVDHSTFTYLVLPEKGFVEFFRREVTADQLAAKVGCFLAKG
jgi:protein SCO1